MSGGSGGGKPTSKAVNLTLSPEQAMDLMTALHSALGMHAPKAQDHAKSDVAKS